MRPSMQVSVEQIVKAAKVTEQYEKALENVGEFSLRVKNSPYMDLVIEVLPYTGVSVCHPYVQNGDLMRDPEIVFASDDFHAVEITQDPVGIYRRVPPGRKNPGIESLARTWARNLREQDFAAAAKDPANIVIKYTE